MEVLQFSSSRNKSKSKSKNKNKFVGVRQRGSGKWVAEIKNTSEKIRMWLGTFDTAEEAAQAYDEAACLLRGSNTRTNLLHTNTMPCNPALSLKIRNLVCQKRSQLKLKLKLNNNNKNENSKNENTREASSSNHHHPMAMSMAIEELEPPPLPHFDHNSIHADYWDTTPSINDAAFWDFHTLCQMFSPT